MNNSSISQFPGRSVMRVFITVKKEVYIETMQAGTAWKHPMP
jgi:hypothetical protein